jgi:purine-binding chemotaxis protein CheW
MTQQTAIELPLLVFHLGSRLYALMIEHVEQVIPMLKLTQVPQFEQIIDGVFNNHGETVAVICGRRHLKIPVFARQLNTPIILVRVHERTIGLIVDEVMDVIPFLDSQISPASALLPSEVDIPPLLKGIVFINAEPIFMLDPQYLLRPEQIDALDRAVQALVDSDAQNQETAQRECLI